MKGRTRSFIEDFVVLMIIVVVGVLAYNFFLSDDPKDSLEEPVVESMVVKKGTVKSSSVDDNESEPTKEIKQTQEENVSIHIESEAPTNQTETEIVTEKIVEDKPVKQIVTKQKEITIEEETVAKKVDPQKIAQFVKDVDIGDLRKFKEQTKEKIREKIEIDPSNTTTQELKIRITVLKSGEYEHLTFQGGSEELFEKNKENITSIFPVEITPSIAGDFPRYLRYTFTFNP